MREYVSVKIEKEVYELLKKIKERDGIKISKIIKNAVENFYNFSNQKVEVTK
jgi:predicted DNA-binding ribbon-helix-helix protein